MVNGKQISIAIIFYNRVVKLDYACITVARAEQPIGLLACINSMCMSVQAYLCLLNECATFILSGLMIVYSCKGIPLDNVISLYRLHPK